jgi:hypothetical protein
MLMHVVAYGVAAAVCASILLDLRAAHAASAVGSVLPAVVAAAVSAAAGAWLLRLIRLDTRITNTVALGALSGAVVVLFAHVLFGLAFLVVVIIPKTFITGDIGVLLRDASNALLLSVFSLYFLPKTLAFGVLTGVVLQFLKRRQHDA